VKKQLIFPFENKEKITNTPSPIHFDNEELVPHPPKKPSETLDVIDDEASSVSLKQKPSGRKWRLVPYTKKEVNYMLGFNLPFIKQDSQLAERLHKYCIDNKIYWEQAIIDLIDLALTQLGY